MPVIAEDNIVLRIIAETQKAAREIDQLDRRVDELEGSTNQVNDQFAKLGKFARNAALVAVIAKATQGMARLVQQSTKAYAEFEKTEKSFEVLVGNIDEAKNLLEDLTKFSERTPFAPKEVQQAAKTLLGFGRTTRQVRADVERLGELSAATGANLSQIALIYGQVAGLGKLQGQDALQFINAGIPIYDLLAKTMNKSVVELREMQSQGKITFADLEKSLKAATEEGGKFFGSLEAQSRTISGLQSTIEGRIESIQRSLGEKLAPALRSALQLVNELLKRVGVGVAGIDNDFVLSVAAGLDATTQSLDAFSNVLTSWVNYNGEQLKLFGIFFTRLAATAKAAITGSPVDLAIAEAIDSGFKDQQQRTRSAGEHAAAYRKIASNVYNNAYKVALDRLRQEAKSNPDYHGSLIEDLTLGDTGSTDRAEQSISAGLEHVVKAALKAYAQIYTTALSDTGSFTDRAAAQSKEARILGVMVARDMATATAQELRNFHEYASKELGGESVVTMIIEGYLKDAEGKEVDQDLVARIGGKLMDSINKWAEKQRASEDNKPGFLQNLLGLKDEEFKELGYYSDMVLKSAVDLTNSLVNEEIRRTDLLIQASRDRLQQLQAVAGEGNAEQLQLEEQRQRELLQQREEYIQRQRQLNAVEIAVNNAITVSNILTGISKSFAANPVLGIVQGLAAAGLIAATIASVNAALTSVPAYWKGTEFVTGDGGIDNVPAMLSRGERVVDRNTNSTLNRWGVKNDDLLPLVGSALGKYGPVSLYQGENVSRREFKDLSSKLERVEKAIYGIQFNVNIDPDGIGVAAGNYRNRQSKRNKLLS